MQKEQLTLKDILFRFLNRILNPIFENKVILLLLATGGFFIGSGWLLDTFEIKIETSYFTINGSSSQDKSWFAPILGVVEILFALFLIYRNFIPVKHQKVVPSNETALPNNEKVTFQTLKEAALEILEPLDDNRRIFVNFSPNSSINYGIKTMMDDGLWKVLKQKEICPNNNKIKAIIRNIQNPSQEERIAIEKMLNHIDAFDARCKDPNIDYSNHQLPLDFADLIYKYCGQLTESSNCINKYSAWLETKITEHAIEIETIIFFGSALYGKEKFDVDCLIKNKADSVNEVEIEASKWQLIQNSFKEKFGFKLHLTVLSKMDEKIYDDFVSKLPAHQLTHKG